MLIQINSGQGPKECEYACYMLYQELLKEYSSLEKSHVYLLIHSGSRTMGEEIYRQYSSIHGLIK